MKKYSWWQKGIVYQIYPRSFQDSNGDGIGDLKGIITRLDYLAWLGVDAVWLSPINPSPMDDFGYDISDYCDIEPIFGTLQDFDQLVYEAHRRGLRIILDYVPNHSSDRHPWFIESRSSRDNSKRDWYIWRDPAPAGGPPTNWLSQFGGGAWEWDERTGQYYLHSYLTSQPDLNWRYPKVVDAMFEVLRFWLRRGIDGFRVDTVHHLIKDDRFRDNPPNPNFKPSMAPHHRVVRQYTIDQPEVHDAIAGMRRVLEEFSPNLVLISEISLPIPKMMPYYGDALQGSHLPFNFHLIGARWEADFIACLIMDYEGQLPSGAWPNWVLGNHDKPRVASRVGAQQRAVAGMLLLTLRGTPTLYYGDEIGMPSVTIPPKSVQDPFEKKVPGLGVGRDPARTPMQWNAAVGAGFTTGQPWLPLSDDVAALNVDKETHDPSSLLNFYRRLIALRREEPALSVGAISAVTAVGSVLTYVRSYGGRRILIALNLADSPARIGLPTGDKGRILLTTNRLNEGETVTGELSLRENQGIIVSLAH